MVAVALSGLVAVAWSGARFLSARGELNTAQARYTSVATSIDEIQRLRQTQATIASAAKPQPNLSGQIADVLVEAGLSPNLLTNLTPEPDAAVTLGTSHGYRRQVARLTLESISMPDLGRFLGSWTNSQPEWTISAITITPTALSTKPKPGVQEQDDRDAASPNRRVRAALTIECLYVDRPASSEPTSPTPPIPLAPHTSTP